MKLFSYEVTSKYTRVHYCGIVQAESFQDAEDFVRNHMRNETVIWDITLDEISLKDNQKDMVQICTYDDEF